MSDREDQLTVVAPRGGQCRIYYGSVLTTQGRWVDAERELRTGLQITQGTSPGLHARAILRLAGLRVRQGRLDEAEHLLTGVDRGDEIEHALGSAALALARGDGAAASLILEQRLPELRGRLWQLASALELLVDSRLAAGDPERARIAAALLAAAATPSASDRLSAMSAGALGRVAVSVGDQAAAVRHLQAAVRLWADLDLPYDLARARFELARALVTHQPELAVNQARRALTALDRIGAAGDADRVAAFLRGHGVTPRTGVRGSRPLTVREREVLRLLGAGLSNPEIAHRLHVSRKTASHHVSSILAKLGLRNRAEAAAHAVGRFGADTAPEQR